MASTNVLFLRPPPNVEFVQGFPGIPPQLPDRPPACVKGVVELRPTGSSIKAKWVKVELRKVETLPGGGQGNVYVEFIGESPVTLWHASDEWDELRARDFPFQIRIPEVIPPSIALERGAGIKYEVYASVLTKGKRGLLRREATPLVSTNCPIVIDKHELHSAWPIYAQPESRSRTIDGYTLTVNRTHTAYGPGDRIAVQTLVRNDTPRTNQVRYYEFSLREHVNYRPGLQGGGKKTAPPARVFAVQEQKIPITMASPLHPGMQAKAELSLQVPYNHTTTSVNWAQRIEVSFAIHVKAVLAGGQQLYLDLPITMSNWTRAQSADVVRRIGTAPNLSGNQQGVRTSLTPGSNPMAMGQPTPQQQPMPNNQWPAPRPDQFANGRPQFPNSTMPNGMQNGSFVGGWAGEKAQLAATMGGMAMPPRADPVNEFGAISPGSNGARPATMNAMPSTTPTGGGRQQTSYFESAPPPVPAVPPPQPAPPAQTRRPTSGNPPNPTHRFTLMNPTLDHDDPSGANGSSHPTSHYPSAEEEKRRLRQAMEKVDRDNIREQEPPLPPPPNDPSPPPAATSSSSNTNGYHQQTAKPWLSAEEEKARLAQQNQLYDQARKRAEHMQGLAAETAPSSDHGRDGPTPNSVEGGSSNRTGPWPTAEEEKERLFRQAQNAVMQNQQRLSGGSSSRPGAAPGVWAPETTGGSSTGAGGMSAGRALYSSAMASIGNSTSSSGGPNYLTAAQEKEAIRYKRAMEAARATHYGGTTASPDSAGPVPYEALFPNSSSAPAVNPVAPLNVRRSMSPPVSPGASDIPPSVDANPGGSSRPLNAREEKERMRQLYEAQDSAARHSDGAAVGGTPLVPPIQPSIPPPAPRVVAPAPPPLPNPGRPMTAAEEKAMLKAKMAAEDAAASGGAPSDDPPPFSGPPPPLPPPRTNSMMYSDSPVNGFSPDRGMPNPPSFNSGRPLTAAEEKAQLRARYANEDSGSQAGPPPLPPPPNPYAEPSYTAAPPHPDDASDEDSRPTTMLARDPSISWGKRKAPAEVSPPPLPQKPPAEYYRPSEPYRY